MKKLLNGFVENINLIIESDQFFQIDVSVKKNNNGYILKKDLAHLLNEAKQNCKNTTQDKKIIHMLIESYLIDEKKFSYFPNNLKCNYICVDIRFICLPNNYIKEIEKIFKNYQIVIKNILNFKYVKGYLDKKENLFDMASKIIDGYNENEVVIIPKKTNFKGFFERFFSYFS